MIENHAHDHHDTKLAEVMLAEFREALTLMIADLLRVERGHADTGNKELDA